MSRPHGTSGWSVVCDCGISCSYSLAFLKLRTSIVILYFEADFPEFRYNLENFHPCDKCEDPPLV